MNDFLKSTGVLNCPLAGSGHSRYQVCSSTIGLIIFYFSGMGCCPSCSNGAGVQFLDWGHARGMADTEM